MERAGRLFRVGAISLVFAGVGTAPPASAAVAGPEVPHRLGPGAWCWFGDPRAVHSGGRTFVGWVDPRAQVTVASYGPEGVRKGVIATNTRVDDHDAPSLLVLPDGRLMVFHSHHDDSPMRFRVSARPLDVSSWGPARTVPTNTPGPMGFTYPNPIWLQSESRIYLFWRGGNWNPAMATMRLGARWTRARTVIRVSGQRPYVKYASNGRDTIFMAFTRSHPREGKTGIYFAKYARGRFRRASGRTIAKVGALPFRPRDADTVYNARGRRRPNAWVHDVAVSRRGRPVVAYATFPSARRHLYWYAVWTGRRWVNRRITVAGRSITHVPRERFYSGGISLDHGDPARVYLSRQRGTLHRVEAWRTPDGGRSWAHRDLNPGSRTGNFRPFAPRGLAPAHSEVLWMRGRYDRYQHFGTSVVTRMPSELPRPPHAAFSATATRGAAPLPVRFRGEGDPGLVGASWDFGDGTHADGLDAAHVYERPGRYVARLTVTGASGARLEVMREIDVR